MVIRRITLFAIPNDSDVDKVLARYETFKQTAVKDGNPYLLSGEAHRIINTNQPQAQGNNIAIQTSFQHMQDVEYYDNECAAHKELKNFVKPLGAKVTTCMFESVQ